MGGVASLLLIGIVTFLWDVHRSVRRVRPELRSAALYLPLSVKRPWTLRLLRQLPETEIQAGVNVESRLADGVRVLLYAPRDREPVSAALLWIHGGGLVAGSPEMDHDICSRFAAELGILVVNVDYRLAPEHPFPAGLNDCATALLWIHANHVDLGVDPARRAVGGASAGGGLAAALAQRARDEEQVRLCFQLLQYPMLDDRTVLRADHKGRGRLVWTAASNHYAWACYLGGSPGGENLPPYASPARQADLSRLPSAWVGVGDVDLFFEEDVDYAERLTNAGVDCALHIEPGMPHAADVGSSVASMRGFRGGMVDALRVGLVGCSPKEGETP